MQAQNTGLSTREPEVPYYGLRPRRALGLLDDHNALLDVLLHSDGIREAACLPLLNTLPLNFGRDQDCEGLPDRSLRRALSELDERVRVDREVHTLQKIHTTT